MNNSEPFQFTSGPHNAKIVICGEAFGQQEDQWQKPFVGASGRELFVLLSECWPEVAPKEMALTRSAFPKYADDSPKPFLDMREDWLAAAGVLLTNVLPLRPPDNKIDALCGKKKEVGDGYVLPPLRQGKYLRPEFLPHLARLRAEISTCNPNLVILLGGTSCWALLGSAAITSLRGVTASAIVSSNRNVKCLPTYHPAAILRNWSWRTITKVDLIKALREAQFPEIRRPKRSVLINPTLDEINDWFKLPAVRWAVDIETKKGQITCIGFARSRDDAIVIPFVDLGKRGNHYWDNFNHELEAWGLVKRALESDVIKVGQNFLYDLQYITKMGIAPRNCFEDTMLLHHALYPEMPKGLGFLGSIYSNEASWKLMRHREKDETASKRDE